jgi:hypothetical protein
MQSLWASWLQSPYQQDTSASSYTDFGPEYELVDLFDSAQGCDKGIYVVVVVVEGEGGTDGGL